MANDQFQRLGGISNYAYEQLYNNSHEIKKAQRRTCDWTIPILRGVAPTARAVLSVGCGNGMDVIALRDAGYGAVGLERHEVADAARPYVTITNAIRWPYSDETFDATIALEVIEHVGTGRDTAWDERTAFASEALRVTRPGGVVLLATPNRLCPADEHGKLLRIHSPFRDATLTMGELERVFDREMHPLPYRGYFAFERFGLSAQIVEKLERGLQVFSRRRAHRSPLNPHLFLWCRVSKD